jgi:hypothetical protein
MSSQPPRFLWTLIDDASIYPPGELPLADAVPTHVAHRDDPWLTSLVGPFVLPAAALASADRIATTLGRSIDLSLVIDREIADAFAELSSCASFTLRGVDVPLPVADAAGAVDRIIQMHSELASFPAVAPALARGNVFVEPGWAALDADPAAVVETLARAGVALKVRTGGLAEAAFPTEGQLASAIFAAHQAGVAFKCTAGLHRAVRHRDERTGFEHHGFLNVLWAAAVAADGGSVGDIERSVAEHDSTIVASAIASLDVLATKRARSLFRSFGSCSIEEPLEDLRFLGLIRFIKA